MPKCPLFRHFEEIKHVHSRDFDQKNWVSASLKTFFVCLLWRSPKIGQVAVNKFHSKNVLLFGDENMVTLLYNKHAKLLPHQNKPF